MDLSFKKKDLATYAPELAKAAEDGAYQFQISETVAKIRERDEEVRYWIEELINIFVRC